MGVDADALCVEGSSLAHWGPRELHRLVAHFLRARFPLLLALNKADLGAAGGNIRWGKGMGRGAAEGPAFEGPRREGWLAGFSG